MQKLIYIFWLFLCPTVIFSQANISGEINIPKPKGLSLYLKENIGGHYHTIDSCQLNRKGEYNFQTPKNTGFYALHLSDSNWVQFIVDTNEVQIQLDFESANLRKSIQIVQSAQNHLLWDFIEYRKKVQHEISQIYIKKTYFKEKSIEYAYFQKIEDSLNLEFDKYLWTLYQQHKPSFFANTIVSDIKNTPPNMDYFYYTKFEDPRLIRSAVFTKKITEYLQFQTNYTEEGFIKSVDEILLKASVNPEVSDFALNYLLELFLAVGPDIVLDYLVEEYVMNGACSQLDASAILSARLNAYENLQLGMSAPNFHILNADGVVQNLKDICSFYKINILFFASSHCQFCHEITPELLQYSKSTNNKLLQVVHISLDTNYSEWQNSTKNFPANWVSLSELKGWDSKSTELFQIHKTPSFYILDQNANIISKPKNMEELIQDLQLLSP